MYRHDAETPCSAMLHSFTFVEYLGVDAIVWIWNIVVFLKPQDLFVCLQKLHNGYSYRYSMVSSLTLPPGPLTDWRGEHPLAFSKYWTRHFKPNITVPLQNVYNYTAIVPY